MAEESWRLEREGPFLIVETPLEQQPEDVLYSFAWDELACRKVGEGALPPVARLWRHPGAMVLGLRDRRLPYASGAISRLRSRSVSVGVRNSGGAAVPLDEGVVNVSLLLPYNKQEKMNFHTEFRLLAAVIAGAVEEWSAFTQWGEISGSFCPGEYDLSIHGKKFCGIAQRRQLRACVVSAFIIVEGSGAERGSRAQAFYREATGGEAHPDDPRVVPASMASLEELAGVPSAQAFSTSLVRQLARRCGTFLHAASGELVSEEETADAMAELKRRYDHD